MSGQYLISTPLLYLTCINFYFYNKLCSQIAQNCSFSDFSGGEPFQFFPLTQLLKSTSINYVESPKRPPRVASPIHHSLSQLLHALIDHLILTVQLLHFVYFVDYVAFDSALAPPYHVDDYHPHNTPQPDPPQNCCVLCKCMYTYIRSSFIHGILEYLV